jgi:hypothetical protein
MSRAHPPRRIRWRILASLVIGVLVAVPAAAFKLGPHELILRSTVYPRVGVAPFDQMLGTLLSGLGNLGSDRHQFDDFRHFDSAGSRQAVCDRANAAWTRFYGEISGLVQPQNPPQYDQIAGLAEARSSFGALTHALQDFYSHSNWIELHVAAGPVVVPIASALFPSCNPAALPAGLETGYFDLAYGLGGCPNSPLNDAWIPPAGFSFCHETLNKDSVQTRHGREVIPGTAGLTYHAEAARLATEHTTALYNFIIQRLAAEWAVRFPQVRADCLVQRFTVDGAQPCRLAQLKLVNDTHNGGTRLADGTVTVRASDGSVIVTKSISKGNWPFPMVEAPRCLAAMRVEWQFYVDDAHITPASRQVSGSQTLGATGCDFEIRINPESQLTYLVRFTNADTQIAAFTSMAVWVNNAQRVVSVPGPIPTGTIKWIDLGPCNTVVNLDFAFAFIDPTDNTTPRTAEPDPPPHPAQPGCLDVYNFDLGGQIYGP